MAQVTSSNLCRVRQSTIAVLKPAVAATCIAELARFYGDPVMADELPEPEREFTAKRTVQRPTTTFPAGWIDIEILCGLFREQLLETGIKQIERGKDVCGHPWPADLSDLRAQRFDRGTCNPRGALIRRRALDLTPAPSSLTCA
jgi:hypothetical protein